VQNEKDILYAGQRHKQESPDMRMEMLIKANHLAVQLHKFARSLPLNPPPPPVFFGGAVGWI